MYNRATTNISGGDFVLLHPKEHTLKALPDIIENYLKIKEKLQDKANIYIQEKSPDAKTKLVNLIMTNIDLPIYLKPFKCLVKKTIDKNFDKLVDFILAKINS